MDTRRERGEYIVTFDGNGMINRFADWTPLVRCRDCKWRQGDYCHNPDGFGYWEFIHMDDFCSYAEKEEQP
jgi:hypothetical protein